MEIFLLLPYRHSLYKAVISGIWKVLGYSESKAWGIQEHQVFGSWGIEKPREQKSSTALSVPGPAMGRLPGPGFGVMEVAMGKHSRKLKTHWFQNFNFNKTQKWKPYLQGKKRKPPISTTTTFAGPGLGGVCTSAQLFIASKTEQGPVTCKGHTVGHHMMTEDLRLWLCHSYVQSCEIMYPIMSSFYETARRGENGGFNERLFSMMAVSN